MVNHFDKLVVPLLREYNVSGTSISLIDHTTQFIKYEKGLGGMEMISRNVSIDGHALLSKDQFVLLDASKDWRMVYNPMVHGPPFIKFYASVSLKCKDGYVIGVFAIFDPYIRLTIPQGLIKKLSTVSRKIMDTIEASPVSPRIQSANTEAIPDDKLN